MESIEMTVVSFTLGRLTKLQYVKRNCGIFQAARYLRNRGYSLEMALNLLNR